MVKNRNFLIYTVEPRSSECQPSGKPRLMALVEIFQSTNFLLFSKNMQPSENPRKSERKNSKIDKIQVF